MTQEMDQAGAVDGADIVNEQQAGQELEAQLTMLSEHYDEISRLGAISRDQAKQLVTDCAVEFDDNYPVQSFTEIPSKTNLAVALEGIGDATLDVLGKLIQNAIAIMKKIFAYILDLLSRLFGKAKASEKAQVNIKILREGRDTLKAMVPDAVVLTGDAVLQHEEIKAKIEVLNERYLAECTPMVADLVANGNFTRTLRLMVVLLPHSLDLILRKMDIVKAGMEAHLTEENVPHACAQLKRVAEPVDMEAYRDLLTHAGFRNLPKDFNPMMQAFLNEYRQSNQGEGAKDSLDNVINHLVDHPENMDPIIPEKEHLSSQISALDRDMQVLGTVGTKTQQKLGRYNPLVEAYRNAFAQVGNETRGVATVLQLAATSQVTLFALMSMAMDVVQLEYQDLVLHANLIEDPAEREKILQEHRAVIERLKR
jgi:hypothetical protein